MTIYEDTRQQKGKHENVKNYCEEHGITLIRKKLSIGDYALDTDYKQVYVDTKQNLGELGRNLFNRIDKERFEKEIQKAESQNADLIILVEDNTPFEKWINPRASNCFTYSGRDIQKKLRKLGKKYQNLYVGFCNKENTPEIVIEILKGTIDYKQEDEFQEQENGAATIKAAQCA